MELVVHFSQLKPAEDLAHLLIEIPHDLFSGKGLSADDWQRAICVYLQAPNREMVLMGYVDWHAPVTRPQLHVSGDSLTSSYRLQELVNLSGHRALDGERFARQNGSTHGRSSSSDVQALRGCRRTSRQVSAPRKRPRASTTRIPSSNWPRR